MSIIFSQDGKNAVRLEKQAFGLEDKLQEYIYQNPAAIPLYDLKEDIKLLILAREFSTESGPIDALGIDQDGQIYLVETKLYKNPDKRTVVAQVLDYGASLWKHLNDFDNFILQLNSHTQREFNLNANDKIQEFFELDDEQMSQVFLQMKYNLDEGNFKFVVLMDSLHDRLKDLIVYMNQNSKFDIYGVELEYYKHQSHEILIPKIYGAQVKKDLGANKSTGKRKPDFNFTEIQIPIGAELVFAKDNNIKARVASERTINFGGEEMTVSWAAKKILNTEKNLNGPNLWLYENETLFERRRRLSEV